MGLTQPSTLLMQNQPNQNEIWINLQKLVRLRRAADLLYLLKIRVSVVGFRRWALSNQSS